MNSNSDQHEIDHEQSLYGRNWDHVHGGYFSNPDIAAVLIDQIKQAVALAPPDVIADLGGGTGFLLEELYNSLPSGNTKLINIDLSAQQLEVHRPHILAHQASVADFNRDEIIHINDTDKLMLIMRSVLHYFGHAGLQPILTHIRAQMRPGEFFIHQTAAFDNDVNYHCINYIYSQMNTQKWAPMTGDLAGLLAQTGWQTTSIVPGPTLPLTSDELQTRYHLTPETVSHIRKTTLATYGQIEGIFQLTPEAFQIWLPYHIFTCKAV